MSVHAKVKDKIQPKLFFIAIQTSGKMIVEDCGMASCHFEAGNNHTERMTLLGKKPTPQVLSNPGKQQRITWPFSHVDVIAPPVWHNLHLWTLCYSLWNPPSVKAVLTCCGHNCCHGKAVTNSFGHGNYIWNDIVTLKSPEMTARSTKSSLNLQGTQKRCFKKV